MDDWVGYTFSSPQNFDRLVFQEGIHFGDGGWFNTLTVPSLVQGVQNNNFTTNGNNFRDHFSIDGFVGRFTFKY